MALTHPAAILFDLDGTLLDDDRAIEAGVTSLHSAYGRLLDLAVPDLVLRWKQLLYAHFPRYLSGELTLQEQRRARVTDLFAQSRHPITTEDADAVYEVYEHQYQASWCAFPDVVPALTALGSFPLAVLTNGDLAQQTKKLEATALTGYFGKIFVSSALGFAKPQPEAFRKACEQLQLDPGLCVYVGDNLDVDGRGSLSAGLQSVWLDRLGSGQSPAETITVIHHLSELPALLGL